VPLKRLVRINGRALPEDTDPDMEFRYVDIGSVGRGALVEKLPVMAFAQAPSRARRLVRKGDTIVSTVRTYLRAVWPIRESGDDLVVSTGFAVLSPGPELDHRFLGWLAQSDVVVEEVVARSVGVSYPSVNAGEIGTISVPHPSLPTQRAIADYLDAETSRIDSLIAKKRRVSELLRERLRTAIASSVFLRPGPEVALRRLCDCLPGLTFQSAGFQAEPEEGVRLLRGINVGLGTIRWDDVVYWPSSLADEVSRFAPQRGDIVIGMDRPVIEGGMRVALIEEGDLPSLLVQRVARIRANTRTSNDFLRFALMSEPFVAHFAPQTTGVSVPHISADQILAFRLPLPSKASQELVVQHLRRLESIVKSATQRISDQIDLLREHRQTIITAAVTGEIDVPGAAA
jgi:type I restriction enzyme, S subunit